MHDGKPNIICPLLGNAGDVQAAGEDTGQGLTDQAVAGLAKALGRRQKKVDKQAKKKKASQPRSEAEQGTEALKATKKATKKPASNVQKASKAKKRDSSGEQKDKL